MSFKCQRMGLLVLVSEQRTPSVLCTVHWATVKTQLLTIQSTATHLLKDLKMSENRKRKFKEDHVSLEKVCTDKKVNTKVPELSSAKVKHLKPMLGTSKPVDGNQRWALLLLLPSGLSPSQLNFNPKTTQIQAQGTRVVSLFLLPEVHSSLGQGLTF